MKKNVTLVPWTDVLSYSTQIGYGWNQAHEILVNDEFPPMYEANTRDYEIGEFQEEDAKSEENKYGYSLDTIKIVKGFMEKEGLKQMTVTGD